MRHYWRWQPEPLSVGLRAALGVGLCCRPAASCTTGLVPARCVEAAGEPCNQWVLPPCILPGRCGYGLVRGRSPCGPCRCLPFPPPRAAEGWEEVGGVGTTAGSPSPSVDMRSPRGLPSSIASSPTASSPSEPSIVSTEVGRQAATALPDPSPTSLVSSALPSGPSLCSSPSPLPPPACPAGRSTAASSPPRMPSAWLARTNLKVGSSPLMLLVPREAAYSCGWNCRTAITTR